MGEAVLDASALLALIFAEPLLAPRSAFERGIISAVNLAEVLGKMVDAGAAAEEAMADIEALGLDLAVVPFDTDAAVRVAALRPSTKSLGLSLGDRACLALSQSRGLPALTADRAWAKVTAVKLQFIR